MSAATESSQPNRTQTGSGQPRVALVTGASRGLGLALVEQLLGDGYVVIAACRKPDNVPRFQELARDNPHAFSRLVPIEFEINTDLDLNGFIAGVLAVLQDRGASAVDLLINNAGTGTAPGRDPSQTEGPGEQLSLTAVNFVLNINVSVPLVVAGRLLPQLAESDRGIIANISSDLGSFGLARADKRGGATYSVSKTALNRASAWLATAAETRAAGTIVVAVHPGSVITELGGPGAEISPTAAAENILRSLAGLSASPNGMLDAATGDVLPW